MSPCGQVSHGFVVSSILVQAYGDVGGVGMLNGMCVLLIPPQNGVQDHEGGECQAAHVHHQRLVARGQGEYLPDGLLGRYAVRLFPERECDGIRRING